MLYTELEEKLYAITENERAHQKNPDILSERYQRIEKITIQDEALFVFQFDSLLKDNNIFMKKESRFARIPKHIHSNIEINYVYSGTCTQIIDNQTVVLQEGDLCILDTNTPHEILPLGIDDIVITIGMRKSYFFNGFLSRLYDGGILIHFLASVLSENYQAKQFLLFEAQKGLQVADIIQSLLCEYFDKKICSNEIIDSYMVILFSILLRNYQQNGIKPHDPSSQDLIIPILKYIEMHAVTITLASLAQEFKFHPNYLSAYIRKRTGKTFKQLVILQRLNQALFYLKNTSMSIEEIAHEVGYQNLGFFHKKFFEQFSFHPNELRTKMLD